MRAVIYSVTNPSNPGQKMQAVYDLAVGQQDPGLAQVQSNFLAHALDNNWTIDGGFVLSIERHEID